MPSQGLTTDVEFTPVWLVLENAFTEIHTKNASKLSFEELYRNAYKLVLKKKGEELYNKVVAFERAWLSTVRALVVRTLSAPLLIGDEVIGRTLATTNERREAGEKFLRCLKQAWEEHNTCMGMLTDVLMYMDRVYCTDHRKKSIFAKSMDVFRDEILRTEFRQEMPALLEVLRRVVLDQIQMARDGEAVDPFAIKANVYMLEALYRSEQEVEDEKLYLRDFEAEFLLQSREFYRDEGERLLKESDAGTYCHHAKRRIDEEGDRCRTTLSESTTPKIQTVVEDELIRNKMKGLIEMESGVAFMVDNDKLHELGLVFELEARVDPRKPELTKAIQRIVMEMGAAINNAAVAASEAAPTTEAVAPAEEQEEGGKKAAPAKTINAQTLAALKWVAEILALKDRFDAICRQAFASDQVLSTALNRSTADVINSFSRSSEYISLFIDDNMKRGIKDKSEAEVDALLEKSIVVLRYVADKDVFETYYKKHLCKRLLLKKSQSVEVEKLMISRMKVELGNAFTGKLEAMFKDMTLSEELSNGYRKHVAGMQRDDGGTGGGAKAAELSIKVLTSMTWPLEAFRSGVDGEGMDGGNGKGGRVEILLPPEIRRVKEGFERFYAQKYSGRRLTWQNNMGDADVKARFPSSRHAVHDVNCSTYAMLILLLFNNDDAHGARLGGREMTLEEIEAATNIPMDDLKRNLQSLAVAPKTRFLVKEPMSREINAGDRFRWNEGFTSKFMKIKVGVVSAGNKVEGDRERRETEKKSNDSRGFAIEAAVVRVMKQRKELPHAQLLGETITQLSHQFRPDVGMIKKKIESLIEREYLERMEEAAVPSYRYLA
ncbi:hypothetical protein LTS12_024867 [Elasticomyces elasticus]|nr:hypothetical protein LTS12_024867 [Elasticomyces elasticus]